MSESSSYDEGFADGLEEQESQTDEALEKYQKAQRELNDLRQNMARISELVEKISQEL